MKKQIRTVTVKSDRQAASTIEHYLNDGWELMNQSSRRRVASMHSGATLLMPVIGLFTAKQKHTLTFVREKKAKPPKHPLPEGHAKGCVCKACCDTRVTRRRW